MFNVAPYILLQCLGSLVAWALISSYGRTGRSLAEAGFVWVVPLVVAALGGLSADTLVGIASCGVIFNFVNWVGQVRPHDVD
jgi:hypothetical protein